MKTSKATKINQGSSGEGEKMVEVVVSDRGITRYELSDPDFIWLITNYQKNHPEYALVNRVGIPIVLIDYILSS
jgi:hypothetical protein